MRRCPEEARFRILVLESLDPKEDEVLVPIAYCFDVEAYDRIASALSDDKSVGLGTEVYVEQRSGQQWTPIARYEDGYEVA